jgi:hypothetical protein
MEAVLDQPRATGLPRRRPHWFRRAVLSAASGADWLFGAAALVLDLAVLCAIPVGQLLALGYLLEVTGRVARSGRLADGFVGVRKAARLGSIALGVALCWLPLWFASQFATAAEIIEPGGVVARRWNVVLAVLASAFAIHVTAACCRGGRLRYFASPFNFVWFVRRIAHGGFWAEIRDAVWTTAVGLRLQHYFWLGLRGFVGAILWLAIPCALLGQGHQAAVVGVAGGALLWVVVWYLPVIQSRFARDDRFVAFREWRAARTDFARAPLALSLAITVTLAAAMPLYLLKIEVIPRELVWIEGAVFLVFIAPARLFMGWALARAGRRDAPRHWFWRFAGQVIVLTASAGYVVIVFLSQHVSWAGIASLFQQHAFLLPAP